MKKQKIKLLVSKGDKISMNQVIALSGMTGSAEVPSVHFELRKRGTPVNPLDCMLDIYMICPLFPFVNYFHLRLLVKS